MDLVSGGLLDIEINKIIATKNMKASGTEYKLILHTEDLDLGIQLLNTVEILRDYNGNIGDYVLVNFILMAGDYIKDIQPKKANLEMTIISVAGGITTSNRYKLIITNNNADVYGSKYTKITREELNKKEPLIIEAQCVPREIEAVRGLYVDGIFRSTTVKNLLLTEFKHGFDKIKLEGTPLTVNVNVSEPNNDFNYGHIVIPTGTKLMDLPSYLQNTNYGVYNGNIGTYLQKYNDPKLNTLFVYPLYDETRFEKATKKLMIYNTNTSKLDYIENTYSVDGDLVKIIAGYNTRSLDNGENDLTNHGVGIVSSNPYLVMERNVAVTDSNANVYKQSHMSGQSIKDKKDGVNLDTYIGHESNLYKHRSDLSKRTMSIFQITWSFPDIELLYPGMPVMYLYEDETHGIVKLTGVLQSVFARYSNTNKTLTALLNIAVIKPAIYLEL